MGGKGKEGKDRGNKRKGRERVEGGKGMIMTFGRETEKEERKARDRKTVMNMIFGRDVEGKEAVTGMTLLGKERRKGRGRERNGNEHESFWREESIRGRAKTGMSIILLVEMEGRKQGGKERRE